MNKIDIIFSEIINKIDMIFCEIISEVVHFVGRYWRRRLYFKLKLMNFG